ncbi:LuxR C-terminal-related transcriptional regulator [Pseudomonas sp. SIMBA_077]
MVAELTCREKEVLSLLVQGYTNKKIAIRLCISDFTVRDHVSSLLSKYGVESRMRLIVVSGYLSSQHLNDSAPLQM